MVVNKGENITMTLQLIKSDGVSVEIGATVSYKILDSTYTESVSARPCTYNSTTQSYLDTLSPSASWVSQDVGSYLVVWSVADTDDDFNDTYTENIEINVSDMSSTTESISGAVFENQELIKRVLGLVHENTYIDNTSYDTFSNLISARMRIYSDSADVGTGTNVLAEYSISASPSGAGKFVNWQQVRV